MLKYEMKIKIHQFGQILHMKHIQFWLIFEWWQLETLDYEINVRRKQQQLKIAPNQTIRRFD